MGQLRERERADMSFKMKEQEARIVSLEDEVIALQTENVGLAEEKTALEERLVQTAVMRE
eukprot:NODE_13717_length_252_cov_15.477833_g12804_i0.p3 GENE.NODE_13717_length_252_cov_15.477833_g12804_i0~~NODE_13717_length_252_cov_15.477833_g12804_i0.p3  ORF type:complete len:70 (-),score=35.11 NODE_13717_length_252_cov_15.477833_g12804_i0:43-222(-)